MVCGILSRCERCWAGITANHPGDRLHHLSTFLGHVNPKSTAVYLTITNELLDAANERFELFAPLLTAEFIMKDFNLPSVIHRYFLEYLPRHKGLQSSTIRSYRDSLRLFLIFVAGTHRLGVSALVLEHLDYPAVQAFLHTAWRLIEVTLSVPATSAWRHFMCSTNTWAGPFQKCCLPVPRSLPSR